MSLVYSYTIIFIAIIISIRLISDYIKGKYNPLFFKIDEKMKLADFIKGILLGILFNFSLFSITDKYLVKFAIITSSLIFLSVTNILNFKCYSIQPDKNIIKETIIMDIILFAVTILILVK